MPLTPIPNQPINIEPYVEDACLIADDKAYCALYNTGDTLYLQAINTSCDGELFCNPNFEAAQGTVISVTNPNFVGSLTGWSISGVSPAWSWDATNGALLAYSTGSSTDKSIWQGLTGLVTGMTYTVTFSILSNTSTTGLSINLLLGGTSIGSYSTNGSYSVNVVAGVGTDIRFVQSGGSDGTLILDTIGIVGLTDCFSAIGTDWEIAVGGAIKLAGTASDLVFPVTSIATSVPYFKVGINVTNQTAGTLTVTLDGFPIETITANGEYTGYNISAIGGGDLTISADTLFDGTVTYLSVEELSRDYLVSVVDMTTGAQVADLVADGAVTYINDRLIVESDTTDIGEGCYKIQIIDPCLSSGGLTAVNILDNDFENAPAEWTISTNSGTIAFVTGDILKLTTGATTPARGRAVQPNPIPTGNDLYITVTIYPVYYADNFNLVLYVDDGSITEILRVDNLPTGAALYRSFVVSSGTLNPSVLDFGIMLENTSGNVGEEAGISYIEMMAGNVNTISGVFTSNCFSIAAEQDCAKLIEGYGDTGTTTHGFLWQNFKLSHRIQFLSFNPSYPIEGDNYMFSDTSRKQTYATRERYVVGKVNYIDQTAHDTVSAQIMCKTFNVDSVQYFVSQEGYKPEWNNEGQQKLAQSKIEMRKILGTLYSK